MYINNQIYQNDIRKIIDDKFSLLKNKTIFITGASGLVGSFLIDTLMYMNKNLDYNTEIVATFSSEKSLDERFLSYKNETLFKPIIQDINQPIEFDEHVDYIFHAASNTHPALYANNPVETIKLNIIGTLNILDFAKKNDKCRTIFLSTLEVYGEDKTVESFKEDDIGYVNFMISRSCYPESKRLSETLCQAYIKEFNLDIVIARLGYIYGPTIKLSSSKADVQFLNKALSGENIVLKSSGMQKRSYCYVADTVSALLTVLLYGECSKAYNVASLKGNVLLRDYANTLAEIANVKVEYGEMGEIELQGGSKVQNSTLSPEKLMTLGWSPKFEFKEGIEHTYKIKKEIYRYNKKLRREI